MMEEMLESRASIKRALACLVARYDVNPQVAKDRNASFLPLLAGCGAAGAAKAAEALSSGGSGSSSSSSSGSTNQPANNAPVFASDADVNVSENTKRPANVTDRF